MNEAKDGSGLLRAFASFKVTFFDEVLGAVLDPDQPARGRQMPPFVLYFRQA